MLVRHSFVIFVPTFILRLNLYIDWRAPTWGFSTEILTLTPVSWVCELPLICIAFHGKVNILLENSDDAVNQNHVSKFSKT